MAERPDPDPDTDPNTLADRLWATTDMMYGHEAMVDDVTAGDLRAAADGLRQLAAITAAIGDPDELNRLAKIMRGIGATLWAEHIGRIAVAASLTPTLTPRRFTCIYCNTPINGRIDGCWHDDNGREACPGESPTTFHEAHPA